MLQHLVPLQHDVDQASSSLTNLGQQLRRVGDDLALLTALCVALLELALDEERDL